MAGNVDGDFIHHGNCLRAHDARFRAGGEYLKLIACFMPEQPFGHLASRGVSGAQNENTLLHVWYANQSRVRLHAAQTESITGTSTSTPTTVARAAPESGPKSAIAVATASSKKLLAPINA